MKVKKFIAYTVVGCFIWTVVLTKIGVILGNNWKSLEGYFRKFDAVIVVTCVLAVVWYISRKLKHVRRIS